MSQTGSVLDGYIRMGLENNHALKQQELNLEKSLRALREANGLFYPSVGFETQYLLAAGGRSIEMPVGDMLNGVYSSLNSILESMGQAGGFPQIENEQIEFLPNNYHDTKVRVIMPLVNAEIYYNRKIKKEQIGMAQAELNVYKRELVKEIKTAYYRYLQASQIVDAYNSAVELVQEAHRVNKKLVENEMAGPEKLYRIEAELSQVKAQLTKAENDRKTAASYFNFLINQPLRQHVTADTFVLKEKEAMAFSTSGIATNCEELMQLNSALQSTLYYYKMKKSYLVPTISNVTDLGFQGYAYTFDRDQQYVMNALNLSWPIFSGFQNRQRAALAKIESESIQSRLDEAELQIELQSQVAHDNYETSLKAEEANRRSLLSSKEYYKVVSRQYAVGQKSLLDLLDARNQLTGSQIAHTISHFETLIRLAELERANAGYNLNSANQ
ncbi:MAG: TolC family protein [Bacteroidales bacterium]|nr:TolC family protein [Bacteroidales bacterium]